MNERRHPIQRDAPADPVQPNSGGEIAKNLGACACAHRNPLTVVPDIGDTISDRYKAIPVAHAIVYLLPCHGATATTGVTSPCLSPIFSNSIRSCWMSWPRI